MMTSSQAENGDSPRDTRPLYIVLVSHRNPDSPPAQTELLETKLRDEGFRTVLLGEGETGLTRFLDVLRRGPRSISKSDIVLVDVFGHRAFVYESAGILLGRLLGKRVVVMLRGGWLRAFADRWPRFTRWVLGKADRVLAPHGFLRDRLGEVNISVHGVIPNIIDIEAYRFRVRANPPPRFLYLRGTHDIYDPERTLRAFGLIQAKYPQASLSFAGKGDTEECKQLVEELELRHVEFLGLVAKAAIPDLADAHDIYLQSNVVENMPVTILEMWASGLPVVATNVGGTPYLVRDGYDGLLVPPRDDRALADAAIRLLETPGLAERLCREGYRRVQDLTWPAVRTKWLSALAVRA